MQIADSRNVTCSDLAGLRPLLTMAILLCGLWLGLAGEALAQTPLEAGAAPAIKLAQAQPAAPLEPAPAARPVAPLAIADTLHRLADRTRAKAAWYTDTLASWPERVAAPLQRLGSDVRQFGPLRLLLFVATFAAAGFGLEWLFWAASRRLRLRLVDAVYDTPGERLARVAIRVGINLLSLAAFAAGTFGAVLLIPWPADLGRVVLSLLGVILAGRVAADMIGRLILSPYRGDLRLLPLSDRQARIAYLWTVVLATALAAMLALAATLRRLGVDGDAVRVLLDLAGLGLVGLMLGFLWHWRQQADDSLPRAQLTHTLSYGLLAIATPFVWLFAVLDYPALAVSLATAALLPWLARLQHALLLMATDPERFRASGAPANLAIALIDRLLRAALVLGAALMLSSSWGYSLAALLLREDSGATVLRALFDIAAAWLVADLIWHVARTAIDRRLAHVDEVGAGETGAREARLATLLPLLRTGLALLLLAIAAMISLSALGVNIGPLLAGAGVAGIAIGFGAQTLVRDIFSGVFFLLDDAFRIGEYVEIERQKGTVEAISLRSMRLRHHRGAVHTVPYGQIRSLTNHSRDWVIQKLEFRMPFDTDVALVKKLVKQIAAELMNEPEYARSILEPPKSQGARRLEEFGMVLVVKFKARPGEQFTVLRELHHRLLAAFRSHGIRLQTREMLLRDALSRDAASSDAGPSDAGPPGAMPSDPRSAAPSRS